MINLDEIFESLINECRNINIEYEYSYSGFDDNVWINIRIKSLNGCKSIAEFDRRIFNISKNCIIKLNSEIKKLSKEKQLKILEQSKELLEDIKDIVGIDKRIVPENEYGTSEEIKYQAF